MIRHDAVGGWKIKSWVPMFVLLLSCSLHADSYYLESAYSNKRNDGAGQVYTVVNTNAWATLDSEHPDDFLPTDEYVVGSGRNLCLPAKAGTADSIVWNIKSLRIGTVAGDFGVVSHYMNGSATMTYGNDGLVFANGGYCVQTYPGASDVKTYGNIAVVAPASAPFQLSVAYARAGMSFCGDLSGDENAGLIVGVKPLVWDQGVCSNQTFFLRGNTSSYLGSVVVTSRYESISTTGWGMRLVGGSTLSGTTLVHRGCAVAALSTSDTLTFGTLELAEGAAIDVSVAVTGTGSAAAYACGLIKVTDSFVQKGKAYVRVADDFMMTATGELPVLTVPQASPLYKDDFEILGNEVLALDVAVNPDAGTKSLVIKIPSFVYLTVSDADSLSQDKADSSVTNAAHWSDGQVPHAGADYYVRQLVASTTTALSTQGGHKQYGTHSFGGDSLTMGPGTKLYGFAENYNLKKLTLLAGSGLSLGNASLTQFIGDELCVPSGTVTLYAYCGTAGYSMRLNMELTGSGTLRFEGVNNTGSPHGVYRFYKASPNFTGRFFVTQKKQSSAPTWGEGYQEVRFDNGAQLGGDLPALDPQAVTLERYGMIRTLGSFTVTAAQNRGVFVNGADYGARIFTDKSKDGSLHELRLDTCLTMNGRLYKEGEGTLTLGGALKFGEAIQDEPIALSNRIDVLAGTLKVASATAVDGLEIAFAEGSRLALAPNVADAAFRACGVRNVKTDTPFVLAAGMTKLPFDVDWSGVTKTALKEIGGAVRVGLLTISAAAAPSVRSVFSADDYMHQVPGFTCKTFETTDDAGNVVFGLEYEPAGLLMILR